SCDPRFTPVQTAFAENFIKHGEIGAAVAVMLEGQLVVDLWGGYAQVEQQALWQRETLVNIFSIGKALTALCALALVHRRQLALDAPGCRYWPEFAASGKEGITVRPLLCHKAGLPAVREALPAEAMLNWSMMTEAIARQEPWWPPGQRHGYHVNTFGFLVG